MVSTLRSAFIWLGLGLLTVLWLPLLTIIRVFDHDPVHYRTGRWFRRLGVAMTRINPAWDLRITGHTVTDPRRPYVVVSNHQSFADIPLISHLPWEMKWIGKIELFQTPVTGWMMRLAGDIPVNRADRRSGARMLLRAAWYLQNKCSVMFFPEGTRSLDGRVGRFNEGAFHLAIKAKVPILPVVVDGSHGCLPKKTWKFGNPQQIRLHVLPPVETAGAQSTDSGELAERVRHLIIGTLAEWHASTPDSLDALANR